MGVDTAALETDGVEALEAACGGALWPLPPCWNGVCVNASCACEAPWEANRFEVDGVQPCLIYPGVIDTLYAVGLGALVMQIGIGIAVELIELRRSWRNYTLRARFPFLGRLFVIFSITVVLLRCVFYDAAIFFNRATTALVFFFIWLIHVFTTINTFIYVRKTGHSDRALAHAY
jgi:hypothetical protein